MSFLTDSRLNSLSSEQKRKFQGLFPELIKRLILSSTSDVRKIRFPHADDIWAPGFDGVVESETASRFIAEGTSVWELGTTSDSLDKINSDYEKRTRNPLGVDKKSATIYLVVPKIWAYRISISEWEKSKRAWKKVHVYDASMLCDWIDAFPDVCAWLFEELFEEPLSFYTLNEAWKRHSKKTNPSLSFSMFLNGRKESVEELFDAIRSRSIIRVKSNTTIDAYGFCLSALLSNAEFANKVIVIKDNNTYLRLSREYKNQIFLLDYPITIDLDESNINLLCYCKEASSVHADIELNPLTKLQFESALKDMGISEHETSEYYEFTHCHILALIRKIPGTSTISAPGWKSQPQIDLLTPLMFMRNYNIGDAADKYLMERLSGVSYEDLSKVYMKWDSLEDAPLKYVNAHYCTIVNYEEAWETLSIKTTDGYFKRLANVIIELCSDISATTIPCEHVLRCRRHLGNLFLNLIYVSYTEPESIELSKLIKDIFSSVVNGNVDDVMSNLSVIAEACPETVMEILTKDIKSSESVVVPFLKTYRYSCVLHALGVLCTFDNTKIQACNLLFDLMDFECSTAYSNSPKDSLLTALCLWYNEGALSLEEKVKIVKKYLMIAPLKAAYLTMDLIQLDNIMLGVRLGARRTPKKEKITNEQLIDSINDLTICVSKIAIDNGKFDLIKTILDNYRRLKKETLISIADSFSSGDYSDQDVVKLNFELRRKIEWIIRHNEEEDQYWIEPLKYWIDKTTLADTFNSNAWAFIEYYKCPNLDLIDHDTSTYYELSQKQEDFRRELFNNLESTLGDKIYNCIAVTMNDDPGWGRFLAEAVSVDKYDVLCGCLVQADKISIISDFVDSINIEDAKKILNGLSPDFQSKVLRLIQRIDIVDILSTEKMRQAFWSNYRMFEYNESAYSSLLVYNPFELTNYYAYHFKSDLSSVVLDVIDVLKAITNTDKHVQRYTGQFYAVDGLVKKVDKITYSEEFAELCIKLHQRKLISFVPEAIKTWYFESPMKILEEISNKEGNALGYFFFWHEYQLPVTAYSRYMDFKAFCDVFAKQPDDIGKHILGCILGRGINGSDGIFPHEFIRTALDEYDDEEINSGFMIGKSNALGVRSVGDGSGEKKRADSYFEAAKAIEIDNPVTANILRKLAKEHLHTATEDNSMYQLGFDI